MKNKNKNKNKNIIIYLTFLFIGTICVLYFLSCNYTQVTGILNKKNDLERDVEVTSKNYKFSFTDMNKTILPQILALSPMPRYQKDKYNWKNSIFLITKDENKNSITPYILNVFTGEKVTYPAEYFKKETIQIFFKTIPNKITIFYLAPQPYAKIYDTDNLTVQSKKLDIENYISNKSSIYVSYSTWRNKKEPGNLDLAMITSNKELSILNFIDRKSLQVKKYQLKTNIFGSAVCKKFNADKNIYFMFGGFDNRTQKPLKDINVIDIKNGKVSKISNLTTPIINPTVFYTEDYVDYPDPMNKRLVKWILMGKTPEGKIVINSFDEITTKSTEINLPVEIKNSTNYWGMEGWFFPYLFFQTDNKIYIAVPNWNEKKINIIARIKVNDKNVTIVPISTNKMNNKFADTSSFLIIDDNKIKLLLIGNVLTPYY